MAADIIAVFTLTISSVGFAISFAVLIFGDALESGLSRAIGSFVIGGGVMAILVAWRSQIIPVATFVQEGPAIVMAVVVSDFAIRHGADVPDVFALLVTTTLATALLTRALGHFGLGAIGRSVPASVVSAFVGGTGWLLFKGGFDVMTNRVLGTADFVALFEFEVAKFWVPGLMIGVIAWQACRSQRVPSYALGLVLGASVAGFYLVATLASSVSALETAGWLLGPFPEASGVQLVTPNELRSANWLGIARTTPGIATVVVVACLAQLLHLTSIRSELMPDLDVDAELRVGANANLAAALFGVTPGCQGFGYTVLLNRLGATRRAVAVISAGLVVLFGVFGVTAIGYTPRFIVGALLVMIGLALLDDWHQSLKRSAGVIDRVFGVVIIGAIARFGLMQGIALAVVTAGALFIVRYSQVDPVRATSTGRQLCSPVARLPHVHQRLGATANRLLVFELQGYLFFGSLKPLEDRLRTVDLRPDSVEILLLDFSNVTGIDRSSSRAVARLLDEDRSEGVVVWVSGLAPTLSELLLAYEPELSGHFAFFGSFDAALKSAEDRLLAAPPSIGNMPVDERLGSARHNPHRPH